MDGSVVDAFLVLLFILVGGYFAALRMDSEARDSQFGEEELRHLRTRWDRRVAWVRVTPVPETP